MSQAIQPTPGYHVPDPWEYQPGIDTPQSWGGFCLWLEMPYRPRRIALLSGSLGVSLTTIRSWSNAGLWVPRARAWDERMAQVRRDEIEAVLAEDARAIAARQIADSRLAQELAVDQMTKYLRRAGDENFPALPMRDAIRLLDIGMRNERLARGMPTEIVAGALDLTKLSDDELAQLDALTRRAATGDTGQGSDGT